MSDAHGMTAEPTGRARATLFAVLAVAGALTLLIHFDVFPLRLQLLLRDWGLHWTAALATTLFVGFVLGVDRGRGAPFVWWLAVLGPCTVLALHELGQWLWPDKPRDAFDSLRDLALNGVGALLAEIGRAHV